MLQLCFSTIVQKGIGHVTKNDDLKRRKNLQLGRLRNVYEG